MSKDDYIDETVSAFVQPQQEVTLLTIRVPAGRRALLSHFANEVDNGLAWGNVQWDMLVDGTPQKSYSPVVDQYGSFSIPRAIPLGYVEAHRDIVITAKNNELIGGNTYKLGISIKGGYLNND